MEIQTFMLFAYPTGVQGNVVSKGVNELVIPTITLLFQTFDMKRNSHSSSIG
jgi:hypothetical protein